MVSKLDSWLEGRGFKSHLKLDGNDIKAMPGSISAPNPGSFEKKESTSSQVGHTKKLSKKNCHLIIKIKKYLFYFDNFDYFRIEKFHKIWKNLKNLKNFEKYYSKLFFGIVFDVCPLRSLLTKGLKMQTLNFESHSFTPVTL